MVQMGGEFFHFASMFNFFAISYKVLVENFYIVCTKQFFPILWGLYVESIA